jgi:hypothetical protein
VAQKFLVICETPAYSGPPFKWHLGPYTASQSKELIARIKKEWGLPAWSIKLDNEVELAKLIEKEPWMIKAK